MRKNTKPNKVLKVTFLLAVEKLDNHIDQLETFYLDNLTAGTCRMSVEMETITFLIEEIKYKCENISCENKRIHECIVDFMRLLYKYSQLQFTYRSYVEIKFKDLASPWLINGILTEVFERCGDMQTVKLLKKYYKIMEELETEIINVAVIMQMVGGLVVCEKKRWWKRCSLL